MVLGWIKYRNKCPPGMLVCPDCPDGALELTGGVKPPAVGAVEIHSVVTEVLHPGQHVGQEVHVIAAIKYPQRLEQMKERVGVPVCREQHTLLRGAIDGAHRLP